MDVKVFVSPHFKKSLEADKLEALIDRFRIYKTKGIAHESFGRDAPY